MSRSRTGKTAGENHPMYGKHHTNESKEKNRIAHLGMYDGEKSPNWRGGISFEPYGLDFDEKLKELTRNRYNQKFQLCGVPQMECERKLCVHHIDYNKRNNDPKNLVALCLNCHIQTNFNREYWKIYFREFINATSSHIIRPGCN